MKTINKGLESAKDIFLGASEITLKQVGVSKADLSRGDMETIGMPVYNLMMQDYSLLNSQSVLEKTLILDSQRAFFIMSWKGRALLSTTLEYSQSQWNFSGVFGLYPEGSMNPVAEALREKRKIFYVTVGAEVSPKIVFASYIVEERNGLLCEFATGRNLKEVLLERKPVKGSIM